MPILWALLGGLVMFAGTAGGSALVFLFRRDPKPWVQTLFLGLAGGIMLAASVWSLLLPAMEMQEELDPAGSPWIPAALGLVIGAVLLLVIDRTLPHTHPGTGTTEGIRAGLGRRTMLMLAVTLHNIPEGFAAGLMFAAAVSPGSRDVVSMSAAVTLSVGLMIQNIPEGAAISLPLRNEGLGNGRSFFYGAMSGVVEPVAAVIAALLVESLSPWMPWLLSMAAGAMIYVVAEELMPEAHIGEHSHLGTMSLVAGFVIMMILDAAG